MKTHLILPVAGSSTRFNKGKYPKFLLIHPKTNQTMLTSGITGLPLNKFESILVVYKFSDGTGTTPMDVFPNWEEKVTSEIEDVTNTRVRFIGIQTTRNQPETVYLGLRQCVSLIGLDDVFMVKDCDSYWEIPSVPTTGAVMYAKLEEYPDTPAVNKSYIKMVRGNKIVNLVEKRVICSTFCVGGYAFPTIRDYLSTFSGMSKKINTQPKFYLSHMIYKMMLDKDVDFFGIPVQNYIDWGTLKEWKKDK